MQNIKKNIEYFFSKNFNFISGAFQVSVFFFIYYVFFGRFYIFGKAAVQGDSYASISLNNLATYSLLKYHEFLWWDPTTFNGWPAYINLTIGWFNYLSPFALPMHLINYVLVNFFHLSIARAVQIQFTSVTYLMTLIMVILISRRLISSNVGRLLPPLIFTLGSSIDQMQRLIQHGPALVPVLFYFYGIIYFFYERTSKGLYLFFISVILLFASINYIIVANAIIPIFIFTFIFLLVNNDIIKEFFTILNRSLKSPLGKVILLLLVISLFITILNVFMPMYFLGDEVIRILSDILKNPFNYAVKKVSGLMPGGSPAYQKIFVSLNQWAPFDDIYQFAFAPTPNDIFILNIFNAKVDMRYIGILTLPLILVSILFPKKLKLIVPIFLTYFIGSFVLPYAQKFPMFKFIVDLFPVMENTRCICNTIARDTPAIFAAILAGIGLDVLLNSSLSFNNHSKAVKSFSLVFFLFCIFFLSFFSLGAVFIPEFQPIRESLSHISIYLIFGVIILIGIAISTDEQQKRMLSLVVLFLFFTDLAISANHYWKRTDSANPTLVGYTPSPENFKPHLTEPRFFSCKPSIDQGNLIINQKCKSYLLPDDSEFIISPDNEIWVKKQGQSSYSLPWSKYAKEKGFNPNPIFKELTDWYGPYRGHVHGFGKPPTFGLRAWLVLYTRPEWRKVIENLDFESGGKFTNYPYFRFFTSATYLPFQEIHNIDKIPPPAHRPGTTFYIHDKKALAGLSSVQQELNVQTSLVDFTPNKVVISVDMPEPGLLYFLDTYDPFWRAYVNGSSVKVYRANFNFKAIKLPKGKSIVEWKYNPYPIKYGWIAFYIVFVLLLGALSYGFSTSKL